MPTKWSEIGIFTQKTATIRIDGQPVEGWTWTFKPMTGKNELDYIQALDALAVERGGLAKVISTDFMILRLAYTYGSTTIPHPNDEDKTLLPAGALPAEVTAQLRLMPVPLIDAIYDEIKCVAPGWERKEVPNP